MPPYQLGLTADTLVFRPGASALELLLIKRGHPPHKGSWALPGGFVEEEEEIVDAAARELKEETNLTAPWLIEVGTYGAVGRDPRQRVITVAYLTLLLEADDDQSGPTAGDDAAEARFFPIDALPALAFDHDEVVAQGIDRLREALQTPDGLILLFPDPIAGDKMDRVLGQIWPEASDMRERLIDIGALDCLGAPEEEGDTPSSDAHFALLEEPLMEAYAERILPF